MLRIQALLPRLAMIRLLSIQQRRAGLVGESCVLFDKTLMTAELQLKLSKTGVDLSCPAPLAGPPPVEASPDRRNVTLGGDISRPRQRRCKYVYLHCKEKSAARRAVRTRKIGSSSAPEPSGQALDNAAQRTRLQVIQFMLERR